MSGPLRISQYPSTSSANNADELVANQNGTTVKLTVGQVRATLASAVHTHAEADIIGTIAPGKLAQAGASSGQVLKWNGSAWAPAADSVGTGGGSADWSALTGIPAAIDAIDGLSPAADQFAYYTGAAASALTPVTPFARSLLDDVDSATARSTIGAAATVHNHTINGVNGLQAALDAKANLAHTHTEADISGTIAPGKLAQAGAASGQVLKWNGSAWAPGTDDVGTGGGSTDWSALTGMPAAIDAIDNLTPAADRVAYYTGANAAALMAVTGFARTLLDDADAATARGTLGAAAAAHGHAIADVTNLQATLDGKAGTSHTHTAAHVTDFNASARGQTEAMVLAGANLAISFAGTGASRTATIAAIGGAGSYAALTGNRAATAADNGRVVECDGTNRTLTLPAGLGKGFACVVRRAAAGNASVAKGANVTFAPADATVATAALWDEIAVECIADTGSAATYLVRLIAA
ncbi:hypothetical protein [Elioraea sp.]|jgi:hypothetical protein|uniref:hypothetical protein n=1 Tax=Elioraea sp. TaxID=2185103 RepID=UPI003F718B4E